MTPILLSSLSLVAVPVPVDARDFEFVNKEKKYLQFRTRDYVNEIKLPMLSTLKTYPVLGTFSPPDEIDFEVDDSWVQSEWVFEPPELVFKDYGKKDFVYLTARESFISLLNAELSKVYPHKSNPFGKEQPMIHGGYSEKSWEYRNYKSVLAKWHAAEKLVMPPKFLIIKMK